MEYIFAIIVVGFLFGLVGMALADSRNASGTAGFWLGFFLGPIGLIIAALLTPKDDGETAAANKPTKKVEAPEPDLSNAKYKVWLIEKYGIEKNDVLGEYICGENSFGSADEALAFAHKLEIAERANKAEEYAARKRQNELDGERRAKDEEESKEIGRFAIYLFIALFGSILIITLAYGLE